MRFFFDGQFEGARAQTPVQLARWAGDDSDTAIRDFYRRLLELIDGPLMHDGEWSLLDVHRAGDNAAALVACAWRLEDARAVIVANVSDTPAQGLVQVPDLAGAAAWSFEDRATGEVYRRTAADLAQGLFVRLAGGRAHLFVVTQEGTPL